MSSGIDSIHIEIYNKDRGAIGVRVSTGGPVSQLIAGTGLLTSLVMQFVDVSARRRKL